MRGAIPLRRRFSYGVVAALVIAVGFGVTGSPYRRVGPGPVIQIGPSEGGAWSVMTARIQSATWFQWATAELSGTRTIRRNGDGGLPATSPAMETAQTNAALVAAQLAARRPPAGGTGLQVSGAARDVGLRPGDVLLAGGDDGKLVPMRTPDDLRALAARRTPLRLLVVPKDSGDSWGPAEIRDVSGAGLASVRAGPRVSAAAYPLGSVRGPSAGLVLALARLDALTPGDLTGGRRVAGTGAIGSDGTVTTVGEIPEKVRAAVAAHIGVFLVPAWQEAEATAAAQSARMRVVPVRSVQEAVAWLCDTGTRTPAC